MLTKKKTTGTTTEKKSVVYQIPCGSCTKSYIGETGRGLVTRLKEHKRDLKNHADHSAFVIHAEKSHHLPNWDGAKILTSCKNKDIRKATEAAYITMNDTINIRVGSMKWAEPGAAYTVKHICR